MKNELIFTLSSFGVCDKYNTEFVQVYFHSTRSINSVLNLHIIDILSIFPRFDMFRCRHNPSVMVHGILLENKIIMNHP